MTTPTSAAGSPQSNMSSGMASTQAPLKGEYGFNVKEWLRCREVLNKTAPDDGHKYCDSMFDTWMCWDYTRAGTTNSQPCPHEFKPTFNKDGYATKTCMDDGTWFVHPSSNKTWSDYTNCYNSLQHNVNIYMVISGYSVSCILLVISIAIFLAFMQLRCTRVLIHQQLFMSFVFTGLLWILTYSLVLAKPSIRVDNPIWCRLLHAVTQYASVSNYFWMFCEGFFLHTIIVQTFTKQKKLLYLCYGIGWGLPAIPVIAYCLAIALDPDLNKSCWIHPKWALWILSAPIVISLMVNFALLLNILRILLSKMRAFNCAEHNQNRRAVKATLILVPLLGLQNLLTLMKPTLDKEGTKTWDTIALVLNSFQGTAVAIIFCFFNGEVIAVLKRRWNMWRHNYDTSGFNNRGGASTTQAMTLDDTTIGEPVVKNGQNRASRHAAVDQTELQPMVKNGKAIGQSNMNTKR